MTEPQSVTEQDIKNLTPQHRIVWHSPPGQPVEMGLYADGRGGLWADTGRAIRHGDGNASSSVLPLIVRIIPPAFVPRVGLAIGKPGTPERMLLCVKEGDWIGHAPEISSAAHWFGDTNARSLIENHGWKVMGDPPAPGEVTNAEVEAAAKVLAEHFESGGDGWSAWANEARAALEAARGARND